MKLSDIMSAAGLATYAEVGLVLFLLAFLVVAIRVLGFTRAEELESAARIPLEADVVTPRRAAEVEGGEAP